MSKTISRRMVLRGLGVSLSLPLLDAMMPRAAAAPSQFKPLAKSLATQPRMICCYVPNGVNILEWMPETAGADYQLSPTLQTLADHRNDFTVLTGMGHPNSQGGHSGADTWLTGADLSATPGSDYTNWVSADQIAAEHHSKETRFGSLQLSDSSGTGSAGHSHTLSFNRRGTPVPAENSPKRLFERLFVPESAGDRAATLKRYAEQKSILDSVLAEAKALHKKLGKKDQRKLDQYLGSVRETEQRVERLENWIDVPKPEIDAKFLQLSSKSHDAHDRPMWIDVMMELSYLAFLTDTTRVISYEWSREAGGLGGGGENHHELSHHGGDAGMLKKLGVIDRFHLSRLARFLDFLKQTEDGDGNMLDHTMVMYGSGMNSGEGGEHSPKNLPLLVAGGHRLGLKHSGHVAHDKDNHPPLSNLLLTMIQKMGVETDSFSDSTGTMLT
ncbi:DUF1552 domain-containing protein [Blastopirellula retiformator]|uniref:DUF1552 domain-containing protein n=1 Tax=Blastopirellula retiformator TaxID=2527970 RepID=A0A5C5V802_9BACT|nr:DUF1552 domain-containing protein [Blastopirellula retiformator]TWT34674.1 hypothetical protein Enr8_20870 [Blastopirellula retiformator]